eukprot:TRINITY_DN82323_c0_g1_i1.p1 TRINITY_DN82323_c0_g1~~TRINITY_DN82323_c0_g1_i1.p1  ORF type:complete len:572 (+),score=114.39 TRINITY_DN82323_c0_g1_i1:341-2056(+)
MLQKFFGGRTAQDCPNGTSEAASEESDKQQVAAVENVGAAYSQLCKLEDGYVDTASESGYRACAEFLETLTEAAEAFGLSIASRSYRSSFSINYRMLFPDEARNYRVDLLGASAGQCAVIWVNGDKFEFSPVAVNLALSLQDSWAHLCLILDHRAASRAVADRAGVEELRPALEMLDAAWASFEERYITELMEIEDKARGLVVEAVDREQKLQEIEERYGVLGAETVKDYLEERRQLIRCIGRLNAVANFARKGRDDLSADVLEAALVALRHSTWAGATVTKQKTKAQAREAEELRVAGSLAADVVGAYQAMREYLSEVRGCLSRVDPHLRNNAGLVARLVDMEETWEIGNRYVMDAGCMRDICGLVAEVKEASKHVKSLESLCESCDVELFLCLPRMVWLRFLADPARGMQGGLAQALLPHRFKLQSEADQDANSNADGKVTVADPELASLLDKFKDAMERLNSAAKPDAGKLQGGHKGFDFDARLLLTQRATCSSAEEMRDDYQRLLRQDDVGGAAIFATEGFMHDLEAFSMELQRHCAEEWNQCTAVLVSRLTQAAEDRKSRRALFRV